MTGYIYSFHVTLINIYHPNVDDPDFFPKNCNLIADLIDTNLIPRGTLIVLLMLIWTDQLYPANPPPPPPPLF